MQICFVLSYRLWGAERIRGELLKLGIHVCKRTIQKYMRHAHTPRSRGQSWATFLRNHAGQIWACDFLHVTDLCFRSLFAFFIIELKSRKVIHVGVTRFPTDPSVAINHSSSEGILSFSIQARVPKVWQDCVATSDACCSAATNGLPLAA